jgi:hypothetical protein
MHQEISPEELQRWGLVSKSPKSATVFCEIWNSLNTNFKAPSAVVSAFWDKMALGHVENNTRGVVFEILIGVLLLRQGIKPFYRQAELAYVNNARFDVMLWEGGMYPIALSLKTSLRERYKQAILESDALKAVHRTAMTFVVTLDNTEVQVRKKKELSRDQVSSLDGFVLATDPEFDALIEDLSRRDFGAPLEINPMKDGFRTDRSQ